MLNFLLIIQIILAVMLIGSVLIQKTSSDGLSGLSSGSNLNVFSSRSAANFLAKITAILAVLFMINSIVLGNITIKTARSGSSVIENIQKKQEENKPIVD